jgi:hypothetical protein
MLAVAPSGCGNPDGYQEYLVTYEKQLLQNTASYENQARETLASYGVTPAAIEATLAAARAASVRAQADRDEISLEYSRDTGRAMGTGVAASSAAAPQFQRSAPLLISPPLPPAPDLAAGYREAIQSIAPATHATAIPAETRTVFVNPNAPTGGYTVTTPGQPTTFVNPNPYGSGYTASTPGQPPSFVNPDPYSSGYTVEKPGQAPVFIDPNPFSGR